MSIFWKLILIFFIACLIGLPSEAFCQTNKNITLLSNTSLGEGASDIWGFVDTNDVEYAIIGGRTTTRIYSLENPASPTLRVSVPGTNTTWRDMKSFGDYVYAIQDINGSDGLLIFDMSGAPTTISHSFWTPTLTVSGSSGLFRRAHNLYIDEDGYLYIAGSNLGNQGVLIFDLFTTPGTPIHVGSADLAYSHDVFVRDSVMYASEIYEGHFALYDVADRSNPMLVATQVTEEQFTHNGWLSDDSQILFTTDEVSNAYVESYDISDLNNISRLDQFRPLATLNAGVIPHNVHVHNDYLVISHYSDGVVIVDAAQPDNLIEVGNYDTYTGSSTGYSGCWGAYPFLPSGVILASDRSTGLYVLNPTYLRACYMRGTVRDINTSATINNVDVQILSTDLNEAITDNFGTYQTGIVTPGTYSVVFSHNAYPIDTIQVVLVNGETAFIDVFLGDYTGPCITDRTITGPLTTAAEFAKETISADGTIASGEYVEMRANESITLTAGFEVSEGGAFVIDTVGCN